jgi:hypothetical protein
MMASERPNWYLYLLRSTAVVQVDYLVGYLVDVVLNELEIVIGLIDSYLTHPVLAGLLYYLLFVFCVAFLFVNLEDSYHQYFSSVLFLRPIRKSIAILIVISLVPSYCFNDKYVVKSLKYPMRHFEDDAIFGYGCGELDLVMVEIEVVLNIIEFPEEVGLSLEFVVWLQR